MISVVCRGGFVQWYVRGFLVLVLAAMLGCQPGKAAKKPSPEKSASESPAKSTAAPEAASPAAKEMPGVETPVQDLPPPKASKEPKKEPAKPSAQEAKPAEKAGSAASAVPAELQATMEPAVKWMPKPVENAAA
jgi:hypothetical protein